jgi:hypothetical protein
VNAVAGCVELSDPVDQAVAGGDVPLLGLERGVQLLENDLVAIGELWRRRGDGGVFGKSSMCVNCKGYGHKQKAWERRARQPF